MRLIGLTLAVLLVLAGNTWAQCQNGQCQAPQAQARAAQPRTVVYYMAPAPEPTVVYREVRQAPRAIVYEAPLVVFMAPPPTVYYRAAPAPVMLVPARTKATPVRDFLFGR